MAVGTTQLQIGHVVVRSVAVYVVNFQSNWFAHPQFVSTPFATMTPLTKKMWFQIGRSMIVGPIFQLLIAIPRLPLPMRAINIEPLKVFLDVVVVAARWSQSKSFQQFRN